MSNIKKQSKSHTLNVFARLDKFTFIQREMHKDDEENWNAALPPDWRLNYQRRKFAKSMHRIFPKLKPQHHD
jgi:hypothetical protein